MQFAFFETALRAQKSYSRLMEPVCKKWNLTHNELDVLLFLANNPEQNRAADIVRGRGMSKGHVSLSLRSLEDRGLVACQADGTDRRAVPRAESRKEHGKTRQAGDASGGVLARTAREQCRICRFLLAGAQPQFQHGGGRHDRIGQEHHTGICLWDAERDGRAGGQVALAGADGGSRPDHPP